MTSQHLMTDVETIKTFVLAGSARLTLVSKKTGVRFTYHVRHPKPDSPHFVKVLTGSDNVSDYKYIGAIFNATTFRQGKKSAFGWETPSVKAWVWFWTMLVLGRLSPDLEVYHENRCGRCGRVLTVPESVIQGLGPECSGRMSPKSPELF